MNVVLNIQNDEQLRNHVKALIEGQVKSIVREEVKAILKDVLEKRIKEKQMPNIEYLVKDEISKIVNYTLDNKAYTGSDFIKSEARNVVNQIVKDALSKSIV